jgi:Tfp pilus assembly protein PilE
MREEYSSKKLDRAKSSTSIEIVGAFAVLVILIIVVVPTYFQYLDKAKLTLAHNTVNSVSKALVSYKKTHQHFPDKIDFTTGKDNLGTIVFPPNLLDQINSDFSSISSYVASEETYILIVKATDKKQTLITLKPTKLTLR